MRTIARQIQTTTRSIAIRVIAGIGAFAAVTDYSSGSSEGDISAIFEQATLNAAEAGYRFEFSTDDKGGLVGIGVQWGGKTSIFKREHFGNIEGAYLRGVRLSAPTAIAGGKQDTVIVVLPFNIHVVDSGKDDSKKQWDVIRLHFHKGKFWQWDRSEAIKGQSGNWKLTSWGEMEGDEITEDGQVKGKILDQGEHKSDENPYSRIRITDESP